MTKKRRKSSIVLPGSSRRKWARRGRAVADFTMAVLFTTAAHIADFIIWSCKGIYLSISAMRKQKKQKSVVKNHVTVVEKEAMFKPVSKRDMEDITFDDVVGLEEVKRQIMQRVILPLKHKDKAKILKVVTGGGILLYGPPGNGKTMLGKAVANKLNAVFFHIKPSDIIRQGVGVSETRISELFMIVRRHKLSVLFMDDVEGVLPSRSKNRSTIMRRVINQYLIETDGLESRIGDNMLLMLGATNEPSMMDPAIRRSGRFDERIYVGLPDVKDRELILIKNMDGVPASEDLDFRQLAETTELFSGADLKGFVDKAKQRTFDRSIHLKGKKTVSAVSMEDFETVLETFGPSVSKSDLRKYEVVTKGDD